MFFVFGLYWGGWGALLPEIKAQVGVDDAGLGRALLVVAAASITGMLAAGRIADRVGGRGLLPTTLAFAAVLSLPGLAQTPEMLALTFVVVGLVTGVLDVFINAVASVHETSTGEKVMGRLHAFFSLGALVGGVAVGALREAGWGVEPILVAIALVVGVVGIAQARVRVPIVEAHRRPRVRMTTTLLLLGALCGLAFLIEDGLLSWSAIHLQQNLGAGAFVQGLGPAVLSAAMVAGRVATARLSERYSERVLLLAGGLIGTLGGVWFAYAQSAGDGLVAAALTGAAISVAAPLIFGLAGRIGRSGGQAAAIARVTTVAYTGFVIGPALVGGVAGAAGLRNGLLVLAAASFLLAAGSLMLPATD